MRPPDPDRQVELVELLAALDVAESLSLDDPIAMDLREVASVEPLSLSVERELLAAVRRGDEAARLKLTELNLSEVVFKNCRGRDGNDPSVDIAKDADQRF